MLNLKGDLDKLNKPYTFNMVNLNDKRLIQLGLEPLYLTVYPMYINLHGNVYFGGVNHYECSLSNDIISILEIMASNNYDRFDSGLFKPDKYTIRFSIYNNQIFFSDIFSFSIYKNNKDIREEINNRYNLSTNFYEPTDEEIWQGYSDEYFKKNRHKYGNHIEYGSFNLTPKEFLDIRFSSKQREFIPYMDPNILNANDIRHWLNYNANIFTSHKCSRKMTGVYNQKTMEYINSLLETKFEICKSFYQLAKKAENWQYVVIELLKEMRVYNEYIEPKVAPEDIFAINLDAKKSCYWNSMFSKASKDLLVQFVGFDKIETQIPKTITTSKQDIYEEFFNLLLMDYNIVQIPKLIFDDATQKFRWITPSEFYNSGINRECEEEIKLIKKYIPYDERWKYFKN